MHNHKSPVESVVMVASGSITGLGGQVGFWDMILRNGHNDWQPAVVSCMTWAFFPTVPV